MDRTASGDGERTATSYAAARERNAAMSGVSEWAMGAAAAAIIIVSAAGVFSAVVFGPALSLDGVMVLILFGVLAYTAVADLVVARFLVMPKQLEAGAPLTPVAIIGLTFALTPAVMGCVAAAMTGRWWIAASLGAISTLSLLVNSAFVRDAAAERRPPA